MYSLFTPHIYMLNHSEFNTGESRYVSDHLKKFQINLNYCRTTSTTPTLWYIVYQCVFNSVAAMFSRYTLNLHTDDRCQLCANETFLSAMHQKSEHFLDHFTALGKTPLQQHMRYVLFIGVQQTNFKQCSEG